MTLRRRSRWPGGRPHGRPRARQGLRTRAGRQWELPPVVTAAIVTGSTWTGIMLVRLFVGGAIGTGDQGDSRRLMCQLGVRALRPFAAEPARFVYTTWTSHQWYGEACGADGSGEPYHSSQLVLLRLAKPVTQLLHFPGTLDLRALGIICAVLVGLAIAALVLMLPGSIRMRIGIASLVGLAVAEGSVAQYFISPYSEPAAILGIVALCAALLWLWRAGESTWPRLIAVSAAATFTMLSKPQLVAVLPAVVLALLWLPHRPVSGEPRAPDSRDESPGVVRRLGAALADRWPALVASAMLALTAGVYLVQSPQRFSEISAANQVFLDILPHSDDRAGDLRSLGVDPSLASGSGVGVDSPRSALRTLPYLEFRKEVTQASILRFYLTHPDRLPRLAGEGLRGMGVWRQNYLGTYTPGSGHPPGARECRICVYEQIFRAAHDQPVLVPLLWLATLGWGIAVVRDRRLDAPSRAVGRLAVVLVAAAVSEFWATMLSEGISDLYKHLIVTNFLTALCVPALVACLLVRRARRLAALGPKPKILPVVD